MSRASVRIGVALALTVLFLLSTAPIRAGTSGPLAVIVSNEADARSAEALSQFLSGRGAEVVVVSASELDQVEDRATAIFVLGGPEAYEGVGEISSRILTDLESDLLVNRPGYFNFFIRNVDGRHYVVLAGHTRVETYQAVMLFEQGGYQDWLLYPSRISEVSPFGYKTAEVASREFRWTYAGQEFSMGLTVPKDLYLYYVSSEHQIPYEDWAVLASDPLSRPYIRSLLNKLLSMARSQGYDEIQTLEFLASFVQHIPYNLEKDVIMASGEYPRFPIETLMDYGGDCEDHAILLATLYMEMGYDVVLIIVWGKPGFPIGHMGVAVALEEGKGLRWDVNGTTYYYIDATQPGLLLGEPLLPEYLDYEHPIFLFPKLESIPMPVLVRNRVGVIWQSSSRVATVVVTVANFGQDWANLTITAGVPIMGGRYLNSTTLEVNVPPSRVAVVTLTFQGPPRSAVKLEVRMGDKLVDQIGSLPIVGELP
ncbi:MAG TPA: hypothetical protein ENF83_01175 [Candidatus Korarchaeota archaeon]|nr:hypothetical protein [Candidatus Korarchaeota archaeon]